MKTTKPKRKLDKYDRQIARLRKRPEDIQYEWIREKGLFKMTTYSPNGGCLTMIRDDFSGYTWKGPTPELTRAIRKDSKLPKVVDEITVAHLPRFAYWQRKIDKMGVRK